MSHRICALGSDLHADDCVWSGNRLLCPNSRRHDRQMDQQVVVVAKLKAAAVKQQDPAMDPGANMSPNDPQL